jgi:signal transduction histidine kinase
MAVRVLPSPEVLPAHVPQPADIDDRRQLRRTVSVSAAEFARIGRRIMEVREEERRRIARDLHDVVGQALTGARLTLLSVRDGVNDWPTVSRIQETLAALDQAMSVVRTFTTELRPEALETMGLEAAIRWQVQRAGRDGGMDAAFESAEVPTHLRPDIELACFRVFQEALTNVIRHASAHAVRVRLERRDEFIALVIEDDGVGFDVEAVMRGPDVGQRLGLDGMLERARLVGGSVVFTSRLGRGSSVTAIFPALTETVDRRSA